jgi:acetyl esterase/lipase
MPNMRLYLLSFLFGCVLTAWGQSEVIRLYPGAAPGSESWTWKEGEQPSTDKVRRLTNVTTPTLTVFRPEAGKSNATGIVIAPGGGFRILAINMEGEDVAKWLAARGVTAFVLKYRVMRTDDFDLNDRMEQARRREAVMPLAAADGMQAVKVVRENAARFGLNPSRIGIMGFSAGGYVAAVTALQGKGESRPDFVAPIYAATPPSYAAPAVPMPLFLVHSNDDTSVNALQHSVRMYETWHKAGAPAEMHVYSRGAHGYGVFPRGVPSDTWIERFWEWLRAEKLVP